MFILQPSYEVWFRKFAGSLQITILGWFTNSGSLQKPKDELVSGSFGTAARFVAMVNTSMVSVQEPIVESARRTILRYGHENALYAVIRYCWLDSTTPNYSTLWSTLLLPFFAKTFMLVLVIIKLIRLMMKGFGTTACISYVAHIRSWFATSVFQDRTNQGILESTHLQSYNGQATYVILHDHVRWTTKPLYTTLW